MCLNSGRSKQDMMSFRSEINRLSDIGIVGPFGLSTLSFVDAFNTSSKEEASFKNIHQRSSCVVRIFKLG